jgi:hypothetical protein
MEKDCEDEIDRTGSMAAFNISGVLKSRFLLPDRCFRQNDSSHIQFNSDARAILLRSFFYSSLCIPELLLQRGKMKFI